MAILTAIPPPKTPRKSTHWRAMWSQPADMPEGIQFAGRSPMTTMYTRSGVYVLSSIIIAQLPDGAGLGPQWLVSVSRAPNRATDEDCRRVLRDFGLVGAEEDNHEPGMARKFWMPCERAHRVDCECKVDERVFTDPDGYRWSAPADPAECNASKLGMECPLHSQPVAATETL